MNKKTFYWVLEACLLSWDGVSQKDLIKNYGINPFIVKAGVQIKKYIQNLEILEYQN